MTKEELWQINDYRGQKIIDVCNMLLDACYERILFCYPKFTLDNNDFFNNEDMFFHKPSVQLLQKMLFFKGNNELSFSLPFEKNYALRYGTDNSVYSDNCFFSMNTESENPLILLLVIALNIASRMVNLINGNKIFSEYTVFDILKICSTKKYHPDLIIGFERQEEIENHTEYSQYFHNISDDVKWFFQYFSGGVIQGEIMDDYGYRFKNSIWLNDFVLLIKNILKKCNAIRINCDDILHYQVLRERVSTRLYTPESTISSFDSVINLMLDQTLTSLNLKEDSSYNGGGYTISSYYRDDDDKYASNIYERKSIYIERWMDDLDGTGSYGYRRSYINNLNQYITSEIIQNKLSSLDLLQYWPENQINNIKFLSLFRLPINEYETNCDFNIVNFNNTTQGRNDFFYASPLPTSNNGNIKEIIEHGGFISDFNDPEFSEENTPEYNVISENNREIARGSEEKILQIDMSTDLILHTQFKYS